MCEKGKGFTAPQETGWNLPLCDSPSPPIRTALSPPIRNAPHLAVLLAVSPVAPGRLTTLYPPHISVGDAADGVVHVRTPQTALPLGKGAPQRWLGLDSQPSQLLDLSSLIGYLVAKLGASGATYFMALMRCSNRFIF